MVEKAFLIFMKSHTKTSIPDVLDHCHVLWVHSASLIVEIILFVAVVSRTITYQVFSITYTVQ